MQTYLTSANQSSLSKPPHMTNQICNSEIETQNKVNRVLWEKSILLYKALKTERTEETSWYMDIKFIPRIIQRLKSSLGKPHSIRCSPHPICTRAMNLFLSDGKKRYHQQILATLFLYLNEKQRTIVREEMKFRYFFFHGKSGQGIQEALYQASCSSIACSCRGAPEWLWRPAQQQKQVWRKLRTAWKQKSSEERSTTWADI